MNPRIRAVTSTEFQNRLIEVIKSNRIRLIAKNITSQFVKPSSHVRLALIGYLATEIVLFIHILFPCAACCSVKCVWITF